MRPKTIVQLNFYFMALVLICMTMFSLKKSGLPESVNLLLGLEAPAATVIKATRGQ